MPATFAATTSTRHARYSRADAPHFKGRNRRGGHCTTEVPFPGLARTARASFDIAIKAGPPSSKSPAPVAGANWQPIILPGCEGFHPLLDGEAVAGAFAAKTGLGWVMFVGGDGQRHERAGFVTLAPDRFG